jgi:acetyl-CoA synthetase
VRYLGLSAAHALACFGDPSARAAELLCDRHPADAVALTLVDPELGVREVGFGELADSSRRIAGGLAALGVGPGDRVATLMGKSLDLVAAMLATWRLGAAYVPLFTAFAPAAISMRLQESGAKAILVDPSQRPKLTPGPDMAAGGWQIVVTDPAAAAAGDLDLRSLIGGADPGDAGDAAETTGSGPFVHMFTSGTTGKPKGVVHPLAYAAGWQVYLELCLGVTGDDVYWCAADPGWAYGLYAALVAPLAVGRNTILFEGPFEAAATWRTLAALGVTDFAAAPTVYRSLRAAGPPPPGVVLRRASSAGEPLTADVNEWAGQALGIEVHDHFGQTEVGMVLGNHHQPALARPLKDGSMGRAVPGWELAVLDPEADEPAPAGELGRLAIDVEASPLMTFEGYGGGAGRADKFGGGGRWYLLGDLARVDADGDFFFQARDDDVIIMAGYRIGPFEIESVLVEHPAVAECAVIGAPDAVRGEVLEAFVVPAPGAAGDEALVAELQCLVKERYAAHAYPRAVHFVAQLPRTPSGKVQRYALRQQRERQLAVGSER